MLYDQEGKKDEAAAEFRKVIELQPKLAEAHYSLGLLLAEREGGLAEAVDSLATAARLDPESPRIHYNYGLALQKLGRPTEAEGQFSQAYKLAPDAPDYLYALAILYAQEKRHARALACAEELARRWPENRAFQELLREVQRMGQSK